MNIREAEVETGLTRANIRFYENEGLVAPERQENGYRNYTKEHIETLKRIKLLRRLGISIEEIRGLQKEEQSLTQVLASRIYEVRQEERKLQEQQRICIKMQDDGVTYANLDADLYLREFGRPQSSFAVRNDPVEKDRELRYPYSWRRFFARQLDVMIYTLLFNAVCYLGFRMMPVEEKWFDIFSGFVSMGFMYILEPIFLHFTATTPGKFLLGIKVYHVDGRKMTMAEGRQRVKSVLLYGMGLNIPVYSWYRLWKSYRVDQDGEELSWDENCTPEIAAPQMKHKLLGIGTAAFIVGATALMLSYAMAPINRGNLSTAELAENLNRYFDYYGLYPNRVLDENCEWKEVPTFGNVVIVFDEDSDYPQLDVVENDGKVTAVSFHQRTERTVFSNGYKNFIMILMQAYGGAQPGMHLFRVNQMQKLVTEHPFENYSEEIGGMRVTYTISYEGYSRSGDYLFSNQDTGNFIDVYFSIEIVQ